MGIDEALIELTTLPTLRLYSWNPSAISIGYFQSLAEEVKVEECNRRGIDIVRRKTGGGAVFHKDELTYSFITNEYPEDILQSYKLICGAIVRGLKEIGIETNFVPLNDLVIGNKKFSGNAQTRRNGKLLQHGTLMLKVDPELMFSVLKIPDEKLKDKLIKNTKERVIGLRISFEKAKEALKLGFGKVFNAKLTKSTLKKKEKQLGQAKAKIYASKDWLWRR
jgi:lipoate-protein ligase A